MQETLTSFRIKKLVDGRFETANEAYDFTVSLRGLSSGKYYEMTGDKSQTYTAMPDGTCEFSFTLQKDDEVIISVPIGASYMVKEGGGSYTSK